LDFFTRLDRDTQSTKHKQQPTFGNPGVKTKNKVYFLDISIQEVVVATNS